MEQKNRRSIVRRTATDRRKTEKQGVGPRQHIDLMQKGHRKLAIFYLKDTILRVKTDF